MLTSLPTSGPYCVDLFALIIDAESLSVWPWPQVPLQDAFPGPLLVLSHLIFYGLPSVNPDPLGHY